MTSKLVRDQPGLRIRAEGGNVVQASPDDMLILLAHKLVEEANEVLAAVERCKQSHDAGVPVTSLERMVLTLAVQQELADVAEVLSTVVEIGDIADDVIRLQTLKREVEGGFDQRLVWFP